MKRKSIFILLILLLLPAFVKAEMKDLKLIKQYNTGYSEAEYMGDYIFLINSVYDKNTDHAFAAMDFEGNYIYEHDNISDFTHVLFDYENVYIFYTVKEDNIHNMHVESYNPKNGNLINSIVIEDVDSFAYTYYFHNFENSIGIESHGVIGTDYVVQKDLDSFEAVSNFGTYS